MDSSMHGAELSGVAAVCPHWADLFRVARMLTSDDDAAILCLVEAIESREATRRKVVQAACHCLSFEIKIASLQISDDGLGSAGLKGLPAQTTDVFIDADVLQKALCRMNPFLRFVWVLRFGERFSRHETAGLLNVREPLVDCAMWQSAVDLTCRLKSLTPDARFGMNRA